MSDTKTIKKAPATARNRDVVIDLIKAIAILGVLLIHASTGANSYPIGSFNWLSGNFYGCITRASVPLFLMCSGALFLNTDKDLSLKKLFSKSILRLVVAMIFWATMYKVYNLVETNNFTIANFISDFKNVLFFKQESHLYYIHITLLIYVLLPVLRVFVKNADKSTFRYALIVWFALGVVYPTVIGFWPFKLISGIPLQWKLNLAYNAIGYFMLGHYLKKYPLKLLPSLISAVGGFALVYGMTVFMSIKNGSLYTTFIDGMTLGVFFLGVGIYGLCHCAEPRIGKVWASITGYLSKASFCIYLVHMFILYEMNDLKLTVNTLSIPAIVSVPMVTAIMLVISLGIYFIISHIPVLKKWIV